MTGTGVGCIVNVTATGVGSIVNVTGSGVECWPEIDSKGIRLEASCIAIEIWIRLLSRAERGRLG